MRWCAGVPGSPALRGGRVVWDAPGVLGVSNAMWLPASVGPFVRRFFVRYPLAACSSNMLFKALDIACQLAK